MTFNLFCDLVRILDPLVFVQSKHRTQTASAVLVFFVLSANQNKFCLLLKAKNPALSCWVLFVTSSGFKLLPQYVQWTKRLYSLRSYGHFSFFIPFANEFATALNEKCPPQSGRHFIRVTSSGFKPETFRAVI